MNINLPNGKTVHVSYYTWLFEIKDEEMDMFYQSCMADDLGNFLENPFSGKKEELDVEE